MYFNASEHTIISNHTHTRINKCKRVQNQFAQITIINRLHMGHNFFFTDQHCRWGRRLIGFDISIKQYLSEQPYIQAGPIKTTLFEKTYVCMYVCKYKHTHTYTHPTSIGVSNCLIKSFNGYRAINQLVGRGACAQTTVKKSLHTYICMYILHKPVVGSKSGCCLGVRSTCQRN